MLSLAGLEFAFECVITNDQVMTSKPSAETIGAAPSA